MTFIFKVKEIYFLNKRKVFTGILIFLLTFVLFGCSGVFFKLPFDQEIPSTQNETILQAFYWEMAIGDYLVDHPEEEDLWVLLEERASDLSEKGFTAVWLPPANKGMSGAYDVGYEHTIFGIWGNLINMVRYVQSMGQKKS